MDERFEDRYERLEENARRLAEEQMARGALPCSECGSADGMRSYTRESVEYILCAWPANLVPSVWYYLRGEDHDSYVPCTTCNPGGVIPEGYIPMNDEVLQWWIKKTCTCQDCKRGSR